MNTLGYKLTNDAGRDWLELLVDGKSFDYINESGFIFSAKHGGIIPMTSGACSAIGCCGKYVEVAVEEKTVIWKRFFCRTYPESPEEADEIAADSAKRNPEIVFPLVFDREKYEHMAGEIEKREREIPGHAEWLDKALARYETGDMEE